jgi:hypothetical protein
VGIAVQRSLRPPSFRALGATARDLKWPDSRRPPGEFWGYPESRAFAELLIDCQEDRTLRAVLVGILRENYRYTLATGAT